MRVSLTDDEMTMAVSLAVSRCLEAIRLNRANSHGMYGTGWAENIEGYCAELAVAKALKMYYSGGPGPFKAADVGDNIQVRWTANSGYSLIVRPDDNPEHFYFLVTGNAPYMEIKGWILGHDARDSRYQRSPNGRPPAWFVPQDALSDVKAWDA